MLETINKDTKIYCSFSNNPGNNGCEFFNTKFRQNSINAIYKSFYSDNIFKSIQAVTTLGISGFAVSAPFKEKVLEYVDKIDPTAYEIGAANTVINNDGQLIAYNTDWIGVDNYLDGFPKNESLTILSNGGFSKAVQFFCTVNYIDYKIITRKDWDKVYDLYGYVFNATPIDIVTKGELIDARPHTICGKIIANNIAEEQYKLYMTYAN
jgi:shikimate dehydrogenase